MRVDDDPARPRPRRPAPAHGRSAAAPPPRSAAWAGPRSARPSGCRSPAAKSIRRVGRVAHSSFSRRRMSGVGGGRCAATIGADSASAGCGRSRMHMAPDAGDQSTGSGSCRRSAQPGEDAEDPQVALRAQRRGRRRRRPAGPRPVARRNARSSRPRRRARRRAAHPAAARRGHRPDAPAMASWKSSRPTRATPSRSGSQIRFSAW